MSSIMATVRNSVFASSFFLLHGLLPTFICAARSPTRSGRTHYLLAFRRHPHAYFIATTVIATRVLRKSSKHGTLMEIKNDARFSLLNISISISNLPHRGVPFRRKWWRLRWVLGQPSYGGERQDCVRQQWGRLWRWMRRYLDGIVWCCAACRASKTAPYKSR